MQKDCRNNPCHAVVRIPRKPTLPFQIAAYAQCHGLRQPSELGARWRLHPAESQRSVGALDSRTGVAPGKRPRLTPNPALVLRDGRPFMVLGSPGGDVQPQAMLQTLLNVVVFGMDAQEAVEAPRFASYSFPDSFEPHAYHPGRLNIESRIPEETGDTLSKRGHQVDWGPDWVWRAGAVCCIHADQNTDVLADEADPRRPSYAVGW